ncbi:MAG: hypothetical protein AABX37_03245 [Nanoarchaeota archaeon]
MGQEQYRRVQVDVNPKKPLIKEEMTIKIRPLPILKGVFVFLIVIAAFSLGRFTADGGSTITGGVVAEDTSADSEEDVAEEPEDTLDLNTVKLLPSENAVQAPAVATGAVTAQPVAEAVPVEGSAPAEEDVGPIITTYTKVAFSLSGVTKKWMETWGKVTQVEITIKNNEAGTIKPSYMIMNMEGYDDYDKKIQLPLSSQTIKAGQTLSKTVLVPKGGFDYNEKTAGNLADVIITLTLYDGNDKQMALYSRSMSLKG